MIRKKYTKLDYNKSGPSKDATKYFIIYEGTDKEPRYFEAFKNTFLDYKSAYVHHVLEGDTQVFGSNPRKLLDRANTFITNPPKNLQFTPDEDDKFRFVFDVDTHPQEQISELRVYCTNLNDAQIYISNFCFEVWLWAHLDELENITSSKSKELKTELGAKSALLRLKPYPENYMDIKIIQQAISRCETSDSDNLENYMPKEKNSKVYQLITELLQHSFHNSGVTVSE